MSDEAWLKANDGAENLTIIDSQGKVLRQGEGGIVIVSIHKDTVILAVTEHDWRDLHCSTGIAAVIIGEKARPMVPYAHYDFDADEEEAASLFWQYHMSLD